MSILFRLSVETNTTLTNNFTERLDIRETPYAHIE